MSDSSDPCYLAALRILNYRFNSEAELRRKLRRRQFDDEAIEATVVRLRSERWLDDDRFAGALARVQAQKRRGRQRILRELQAAGIDGEVAVNAVRANVDPEKEREALRELARRRARTLARKHGEAFLTSAEGRNKLTVYLLNQGYDAALVHEALKEITVVDDQPDS